MRLALPSALAALAASTAVLGGTVCYVPDGTDRHEAPNVWWNSTYEPCEQNGDHSMCCNVSNRDECRGGLCWNEADKLMWRESCSDPTWQSPKCLKLCISDELDQQGTPMSATDVTVTQCADETYCCGHDRRARDCCLAGKGVRIVNGQVVDPSPSPSPSPSSSSSSSPTSPTFMPSSFPGASSVGPFATSGGGNNGTGGGGGETPGNQAGIVVGAVFGGVAAVMIFIVGGLFVWRRKRRRTAPNADATSAVAQDRFEVSENTTYGKLQRGPNHYALELPVDSQPVELGGESAPPTDRR